MTEMSIAEALQLGISAHKKLHFAEADRLYTAIINAVPDHADANHNLGVLAVDTGQLQTAIPFFQRAIEKNTAEVQYWKSLIDLQIRLGELDAARKTLASARQLSELRGAFSEFETKLVDNSGSEIDQEISDLVNLLQQGLHRECLNKTLDLLKSYPKSHKLYNVKGTCLAALTLFSEALEAFEKSIICNPNYPEAYNNLAITQKKIGNINEALEAWKKATNINPDFKAPFLALGQVYIERSEFEEASSVLEKILERYPNDIDALGLRGDLYLKEGKFVEAKQAYEKLVPNRAKYLSKIGLYYKKTGYLSNAANCFSELVQMQPEDVQNLNEFGLVLTEMRDFVLAEKRFNQALNISKTSPELHHNLANMYKFWGHLAEAEKHYKAALEFNPNQIESISNCASVYKDKGEAGLAKKYYKRALSLDPCNTEVIRQLSNFGDIDTDLVSVEKLIEMLELQTLRDQDVENLCFAIANISEKAGNYTLAYKYLSIGNAAKKKYLNYNFTTDYELFDKVKNNHDELVKLIRNIQPENITGGATPIFIIGMPRSGTTLIEQILSAHSQITGAGELPYFPALAKNFAIGLDQDFNSLKNLKRNYEDMVERNFTPNAYFTDKLPHNFLFCGLICELFPDAKIVHLKRQAQAVCWSNFRQYFSSSALGYSCDIEDIVSFYNLYADLMKFWGENYDERIYECNYDQLTLGPTSEIEKLFEYLDIQVEPACFMPHKNARSINTASQQQVRKEIYSHSSDVWRLYQKHLDSAFSKLIDE